MAEKPRTIVVTDENGVVGVLNPPIIHEVRDFKGENPHPQCDEVIVGRDASDRLILGKNPNVLYAEWEDSKRMYDLLGHAAIATFVIMALLILAVVISEI